MSGVEYSDGSIRQSSEPVPAEQGRSDAEPSGAGVIRRLTEREQAERIAASKFCDCLRQDFGNVYLDAQGNHYVEIDGRWMHWRFVALLDERP